MARDRDQALEVFINIDQAQITMDNMDIERYIRERPLSDIHRLHFPITYLRHISNVMTNQDQDAIHPRRFIKQARRG